MPGRRRWSPFVSSASITAVTAACIAGAAMMVACGDASVGSAQDWTNGTASSTSGSSSSNSSSSSSGSASSNSASSDDAGASEDAGAADDAAVADAATPSVSVTSTMSSTGAVDIDSTTTIPVALAASGGFKGKALLSVTGLPTGVTGTFDSAQVDLSSGAATANLTLTSTMAVKPVGSASYSIVATPDSAAAVTLPATLKVTPRITLHLPANLENTIGTSSGFNGGKTIALTANDDIATNPILIVIHNDDATDYFEIHAGSDALGFHHGVSGGIAPNSDETFGGAAPRCVNAKTTGVSFYLHGFGTSTQATNGNGGGSSSYPGMITVD